MTAVVKEFWNGEWYCTRGEDMDTEYLNDNREWTLVGDEQGESDGAFNTVEEAQAAMVAAGVDDYQIQTAEDFFGPMLPIIRAMAGLEDRGE